jgi:hypothetical protein
VTKSGALWTAKWVAGPLLVALLSACLAQLWAGARQARFFAMPARPTAAESRALEMAPARAAANAAWALGSPEAVKETSKWELDQLAPTEVPRRVQLLLRFGIVDTNPDGQAALFGQVCAADAAVCDHLKDAAERETRTRLVAPGNHLPLFFIGGHPHVPSM